MRYELSDYGMDRHQADAANNPRGVRRVDDGRVLNGIFWVLRSGVLPGELQRVAICDRRGYDRAKASRLYRGTVTRRQDFRLSRAVSILRRSTRIPASPMAA
jgi:transposase